MILMQNFHLFFIAAYLLLVDSVHMMNDNQLNSIQIECKLECVLLHFKYLIIDVKDVYSQSMNHSILELIVSKHCGHEQRFHDLNKQSENLLMLSEKD